LRLELIAALKRQLKVQGVTYSRLAQSLGLSEAAIKRMFSRQALSLVRLEQICAVLGIGLAELAIESRQGQASLAELDAESEDALVREPALLLALYLVLNRWSEAEVLARYRFSPVEWTALLARLDRMGILELQPHNRVRLRTARNFRWRKGGPMQRFFQQKLLPEYFGKDFESDAESLFLLSGMVSASSAAHIQRRLAELGEEFDLLMAQDAGLPAARRQGVSLVLAQRPWSLRLFAGLRRTDAG